MKQNVSCNKLMKRKYILPFFAKIVEMGYKFIFISIPQINFQCHIDSTNNFYVKNEDDPHW